MEKIWNMIFDYYVVTNHLSPPDQSPPPARPPRRPFMWRHSAREPLNQVTTEICGLGDRAESAAQRLAKIAEEEDRRELERQNRPWWKHLFRA